MAGPDGQTGWAGNNSSRAEQTEFCWSPGDHPGLCCMHWVAAWQIGCHYSDECLHFYGVQVTEFHLLLGLVCDKFSGLVFLVWFFFLTHPCACLVPDHPDKLRVAFFSVNSSKPFITLCLVGDACPQVHPCAESPVPKIEWKKTKTAWKMESPRARHGLPNHCFI